jgi:hypothetical protein
MPDERLELVVGQVRAQGSKALSKACQQLPLAIGAQWLGAAVHHRCEWHATYPLRRYTGIRRKVTADVASAWSTDHIRSVPNYKAALDKLTPFDCDEVELRPYVSVALHTRPIWAVEIGGVPYATGIEADESFEDPTAIKEMICDWFKKARRAGRFRGNPAIEKPKR